VLTTHNKILVAQIAQKASFSSAPSDRLPSKPEHNPHEQCNCVNLKEEVEDFTDSEDIPMEEGREITMVKSKERNDGGKAATFIENGTVEIPTTFSCKLPDLGGFSIPCIVGKVEIERALCDLGASVSLMPYALFRKFHLRPLQIAPFSLQLPNGFKMQPIGKLEDVPVNVGDIWILEDFIIVDMLEDR